MESGTARKLNITFVYLNLYHLLTNKSEAKGIGGAELQCLLVIRELARRRCEVSVITYSYGQDELQDDLPFKVLPAFKRHRRIPFLGRLSQAFGMLRTLQQTCSDLYCVNAGDPLLALVVMSAKLRRRQVLARAANDVVFNVRLTSWGISNVLGRLVHFWGLRRCDFYMVQNRTQLKLLKQNFGKAGRIIYNGLPRKESVSSFEGDIVWVAGQLRAVKNPRMFLELARRIPRGRFVMVGGNPITQGVYSDAIAEEARCIPNVDFKGFLPFDEVEELFARASLLVNTSEQEGFPNTFLQAWSRGIPVISTNNVDPDGLIVKHNLGKVVSDVENLVGSVGAYLEGRLRFSADEIKAFFDKNLCIERTVDEIETLVFGDSQVR